VSAVRFTVGLLMVGGCSGGFAKHEATLSRVTVTRLAKALSRFRRTPASVTHCAPSSVIPRCGVSSGCESTSRFFRAAVAADRLPP
jgi:hypothetical protein